MTARAARVNGVMLDLQPFAKRATLWVTLGNQQFPLYAGTSLATAINLEERWTAAIGQTVQVPRTAAPPRCATCPRCGGGCRHMHCVCTPGWHP